MHYTTSCNIQYNAPEDGQSNCPKHVELTGIINKPLLLHLVGCLYYLYQWCTVKQISDNDIYLLIKYIKSVLRRVVKRLSYIEDARWLKINQPCRHLLNLSSYSVTICRHCQGFERSSCLHVHESDDIMTSRNVGNNSPIDIAKQPSRPESSA